ncbi:MAG TPA: hypothetical protein VGS58_15300, partial [Candidatus Sulfopaludibacter sp.]|nr:hypothetical protein [Candidatus Sulfopaludibacter sp.]
PDRFGSELLRGERQEPAKSDARVTGFAPPPAFGGRGGRGGFGAAVATPIDFNFSRLAGGFLTAYESYLQRELSFGGGEPASRANAGDGVFYLMSGGVQGFAATGNDDASLANAFARNPRLRLFVAVNYYDLGAPFYATEYTVAHLNVSPEVRAHHITVSHYEAGQMTYADDKGLAQLQRDLSSFLTEATKE